MESNIELKAPRRERTAQVKARIITAATQLLKEKGMDYLTVSNICKVAGVSVGSFYHHFSNKDEVLSYTNQMRCLRLWLRTYPEVNKVLMFGDKSHKSTYREKLWLFAICMGMYPRFKRRLLSRRFKPDRIWRIGI